ncbi:MAG: hypothetical protein F6K22_07700 [Okeania sp. SIO2F4]|uniref:hypothetical protein n=1 Tax=Okeania sp. SIO2F4 TaxID=2607790 RepID=UPI00142B9EAB|nr:hypothetical protein [Okeania sp. SIO2F4]NES02740.1 hypothetical protein [Okeania sp. SIO2F4]
MIQLPQGNRQQFRWRHNDINIQGKTDAKLPIVCSVYLLNGGSPVHFYVEPEPELGEPKYPWGTRTPSVLRLLNLPGHFNIEIPVDTPALQEGWNSIRIQIEDGEGEVEVLDAEFHWNSHPLPLPLNLQNLSSYNNIQEIAQVVDGNFDINREKNAICSRVPVGSDILLLLGSPYGSQEATYDVRFARNENSWCFLGLSDFFAGHIEQSPDLGIKPGYSSAGLATLDNKGRPQIWIAWGDSLYDKEDSWVIKTEKEFQLPMRAEVTYSVRHQVIMDEGVNCGRFRIWKKGNPEPNLWVCQEYNKHLDGKFPRITQASFGLFQYWGMPTEWSNIHVRALDIKIKELVEK